MVNSNPLPFPLSSYWAQLSLSVFGLVWVFVFLLGLYKLIKCEHRRFAYHSSPYLFTFDTRRYLRSDDDGVSVNPGDSVDSGGLDYDTVLSLPFVVFREEGSRGGGGGSECAICLAEFGDGDRQRLLPSCRHAFHVDCIDTWFRSRSDCPLCRKRVVCGYSSADPVVRPLEPLPREDVCGERLLAYHSSFSA